MRDQLLATLQARLFTPGGVLEPEALDEVERLLDHLPVPDGADGQVLHTAGLVYWLRATALPAAREEDRERAALLLMPLYLSQPDTLPDEVRSWFDTLQLVGEELQHAYLETLAEVARFVLRRSADRGRGEAAPWAVALLRMVASKLPVGYPYRLVVLCDLGYALLLGLPAELPGDVPPELDEAVAVLREAFDGMPEDDAHRARCANGLALAVRAKAVATRDPALLSQSAAFSRIAVDAATSQDGNLPQMLADLGATLMLLAQTGDGPAAEEAVTVLGRAMQLAPDPVRRQELLRRLAAAELLRTGRAGPVAPRPPLSVDTRRQMEEMTALFRRVIPATGDGVPDDPDNLLAVILRLVGIGPSEGEGQSAQLMDGLARLLRTSSGPQLEELVDELVGRNLGRLSPEDRLRAVLRGPADPPEDRTDHAELDELLDLHERLLREVPGDSPEHSMLELGLLLTQFLRARQGGPDERSFALLPRVMETTQTIMARADLSASMLGSMTQMSQAVVSPFETLAVFENAIRRHRERLAAAPDDLTALKELSLTLFQRYQLTYEEPAYREAVRLARQVVARDLTQAAWVVCVWGSAMRLRAMGAVPDEGDELGSGLARMASDQAAAAADGGDPAAALEALEEGRGRILTSAVNARVELENLRAADAGLAARFVAVRERVRPLLENPGREAGPGEQAALRAVAEEWTEVSGRIQALPEFGRFLMPLPLGVPDLRPVAADGPVVVVNVNRRRCDALILTTDGVRLVPLPYLRAAELADQAEAFHDAVQAAHASSGLLAGQAERVLLDTLGWLWDVVAEPVLGELGLTESPEGLLRPRLWWSPTGPLTFLPLHAAGRPDVPGASVLDRVVPSYTPTLRALMHSRSRAVPAARSGLSVAMPVTPGQAPLPRTAAEAVEVASLVRGATLVGPDASREAVLAALPRAAVAHFACHAGSDPRDPSASHLLLHDGPLGLSEIGRLQLDGAELAYLSACATARGGSSLADEAIHLASAFQLAGYGQAVATLWEIGDDVAARTAAAFHRELGAALDTPERLPGARALHAVTRRLREAVPDRPSAWAAFLHAGA
ncbi:CHAT domain-containing protein [Nonomuraea maritima]|uniref:CHAT domain-containing protein n=1 Tax=Nonomuraea maritima TaxID=683260 RepID=UPI00372216C7